MNGIPTINIESLFFGTDDKSQVLGELRDALVVCFLRAECAQFNAESIAIVQ